MTDALTYVDLATLASEIQQEHQAVELAVRDSLTHARRAGELLLEAKDKLPHGEFIPWVEANCAFALRTAQLYMRLTRKWAEVSNAQRVAHLTLRDVADLLADPRRSATQPESETSTLDPEDRRVGREAQRRLLRAYDPTTPAPQGIAQQWRLEYQHVRALFYATVEAADYNRLSDEEASKIVSLARNIGGLMVRVARHGPGAGLLDADRSRSEAEHAATS